MGTDGVVAFRRGTADPTVAEATSPEEEETAPSGEVKLGLSELVRWGNPISPRGQTIVVLADGGQIVTAADWSGGAAVRMDGDAVVVLSDLFGEIRLAKEMVHGVVFAQRRHVAEREKLVGRVREPSSNPSLKGRGSSDAVMLANGDKLNGSVKELTRGSLAIETNAGVVKLPLSRVDAVMFGGKREPSLATASPKRPGPLLRRMGNTSAVGLRDGSLVHAKEIVANEKELKLKVEESLVLGGAGVGDIVFLQPLAGQVVYLSDLEPANYRHVPYLNVDWPYKRDRNVLGEPLVVGGRRYLKGIGMHSAGRLSYRLDGKYSRFDAAVAIDDAAGGRGSATFGVYVLRDGKMSEAYNSGIVRGGESSQPVSIDVSGAQGLTLTVDYADRGDELDRADWLDARLVAKRN